MFKKLTNILQSQKLGLKLALYFIAGILLVVTTMLTVVIKTSNSVVSKQAFEVLENKVALKAISISTIYNKHKANILAIKHDDRLLSTFQQHLNNPTVGNARRIEEQVNSLQKKYRIDEIEILDVDGDLLFTDKGSAIRKHFKRVDVFDINNSKSELYVHDVIEFRDKKYMQVYTPLEIDSNRIAYIGASINLTEIFDVVNDNNGLGATGETLITSRTKTGAVLLNKYRHIHPSKFKEEVSRNTAGSELILKSVKAKVGSDLGLDYRGTNTFASWTHIPELGWGILMKIDAEEAFADVTNLSNKLLILGIIILSLGIWTSFLVARSISEPIKNLGEALVVLAEGRLLSKPLVKTSKDEVGDMIDVANDLAKYQKEIVDFSNDIRHGEFNTKFEIKSDDDALSSSLIQMRNSLRNASEEDYKRNWNIKGLAKFNEILRDNNENINKLGDCLISNLVNYLNINQGGIYIINNKDKGSEYLELISCYAFGRKKYAQKKIKKGEGLIGAAWDENDKIILTDVPNEYIQIKSGLGDANPTYVAIIPFKLDDFIYGILEIASFRILEEYEVEFLEKLAENIAITISRVQTNVETTSLLADAAKMKEQMKVQEENISSGNQKETGYSVNNGTEAINSQTINQN